MCVCVSVCSRKDATPGRTAKLSKLLATATIALLSEDGVLVKLEQQSATIVSKSFPITFPQQRNEPSCKTAQYAIWLPVNKERKTGRE